MRRVAHLGGDRRQDTVHEPPAVVGREPLGQLDGLVDDDRERDVGACHQLVGGQPHHAQIDHGHPPEWPVAGLVGDRRVDLGEVRGDPDHQVGGHRIGVDHLQIDRGRRVDALGLGLVQQVERPLAGVRTCVWSVHQTRVMYSPVRVSTLTLSPVSTNSGTCRTLPVSSVACLRAPDTRSP